MASEVANYAIANYLQEGYVTDILVLCSRFHGNLIPTRLDDSKRRLEAGPHQSIVIGSIRHHSGSPAGLDWQEATCLSGPRLSGCRRLHGSWQLSELARGRIEVRLFAAHDCATLQHDGDPVASAVRAARHRRWT